MRLKRIRLLRHVFPTFTLFFLMYASSFLGTFLPVYGQNYSYEPISSQGTVNYEVPAPPSSPEKFLSVFHTGSCLWDVYNPDNQPEYTVWTPARQAGIVKWGMAGQNIPSRGNKAWLQADGSVTGAWTNSRITGIIQKYLPMDIVPVMEMNVENFETATESMWTNFFTKLGDWVKDVDSTKHVIWDCGAEVNFPDDDPGWNGFKIDYRNFNPQMTVIRNVIDKLRLQNNIWLACHFNSHKSYYNSTTGSWKSQDWYTGYVGIKEYLPGAAKCDIIGWSQYEAFSNPAYNPGGISWQENLVRAFRRMEIATEMINKLAGKTLPAAFFEFSLGNVWKHDKDPIWKSGVTYVYTQMVPNNSWCKGLNWYCGQYIDADAMQELVEMAKQYDGY